jgi:hypothetical protein
LHITWISPQQTFAQVKPSKPSGALHKSDLLTPPPPTLNMAHRTIMTKIRIKHNRQRIASWIIKTHTEPTPDHTMIRRTTTTSETQLPEYTKAIVLQKIKGYEEKQMAKQVLRQLVKKIAITETGPKEKPALQVNTQPDFKVEIWRKTPSSSQESSPRSSKHCSDDRTASPRKKRKSLPWKECLFFTPANTLTPEWREAQQGKIPPVRMVKMSRDSDVTIKPGPYDLPEDLQEYEGMQLVNPSSTPDLWEGPLPVPQPQTPNKWTPIGDITENVFIKPHTPNPEPEETYLDDLYMEEVPELEQLDMPPPTDHYEELYMDTGKDPDPSEPS